MKISFHKNKLIIIGIFLMVAVLSTALLIKFYVESPDVVFLADSNNAEWVTYPHGFDLIPHKRSEVGCIFKIDFQTGSEVRKPEITIQALKKVQVTVDKSIIFQSDNPNNWKMPFTLRLPFDLEGGRHTLSIIAISDQSYPAIIAYSKSLPVNTPSSWQCSMDNVIWKPVSPANAARYPELSGKFPNVKESLAKTAYYFVPFFMLIFSISLVASRRKPNSSNLLKNLITPKNTRWFVIGLWSILAANNIFKIDFYIGQDVLAHIDYIRYIATMKRLPLATDGWQMFQSPLYYIVSSVIYGIARHFFDLSETIKILRIVPLSCGILMIEIVYRTTLLVFSKSKELQIISIIAGALIPMHIYICQVVGNEPLAGLFIALTIYFCFRCILLPNQSLNRYFFPLMGLIWGLGLLTKVTAVLLAPILFVVIVYRGASQKCSNYIIMKHLLFVFGTAAITAGWYYMLNYMILGKFFIGGWDPAGGIAWWQSPGYRTWNDFLSFGQSLKNPIYSSAQGFLDALYSTMWCDGNISGQADLGGSPPWNYNFMISGAIWGIVPSSLMVSALFSSNKTDDMNHKKGICFSVLVVLVFVFAILDLFVKLPIFSTAKASYSFGAIPCYAVLISGGARPFLKNNTFRHVFISGFGCWALASYLGFFVL